MGAATSAPLWTPAGSCMKNSAWTAGLMCTCLSFNIWELQEQFLWNKRHQCSSHTVSELWEKRNLHTTASFFFFLNTPEQFGVLINCSGERRRSLRAQRNVPPSVLCDCMAETRMRSAVHSVWIRSKMVSWERRFIMRCSNRVRL